MMTAYGLCLNIHKNIQMVKTYNHCSNPCRRITCSQCHHQPTLQWQILRG